MILYEKKPHILRYSDIRRQHPAFRNVPRYERMASGIRANSKDPYHQVFVFVLKFYGPVGYAERGQFT